MISRILDRRAFLALSAAPLAAQASTGAPLVEAHFPNRLCQFVWRNWALVNTNRMAEVVGATTREILALGASLGLPPKRRVTEDQLRRGYVTVIRQNWHLLPEEQLIALLGWNAERLAFTLKEDDFLDVKLGMPKPRCEPVKYATLSAAEQRAAALIRKRVAEAFGAALRVPGEERFAFVEALSSPEVPSLATTTVAAEGEFDLRAGWRIAAEGDMRLRGAAERLTAYLGRRFAVRLGGRRQITLALDMGVTGWNVVAARDSIRITAGSFAELVQAVHDLETRLERRDGPFLTPGEWRGRTVWTPRFLYSYFALYGDPLLEPEADPFPEAYLEKLARSGINGVWLQGLLNGLAPSPVFPEFGRGAETRLRNLRALTERAADYGVKVYLYLNEPRAMPEAFFAGRPEMRGSRHGDLYALCTSAAPVRAWVRDSLTHLFREVPELGGIFTISMSENHTNCFSHGGAWRKEPPMAGDCPRCGSRSSWDVIGELFLAMEEGVRRAGSKAEIIHYDWGWPDEMTPRLLEKLPASTSVASISEWSVPVERGGVRSAVGEYSISVVGPGPRAKASWAAARKRGMRTIAKVQFNNTWEISAVPYIPVPGLIADHCRRLREEGVDGIMAAWTCGGYPSPNLRVAHAFAGESMPDEDRVLQDAALVRFGRRGASEALTAWRLFSEAFLEFPYGVAVYIIPTQHGPANLLRLEPTGLRAGMILFPHDAWKAWCGKYPPLVVEEQFARLAALWNRGLAPLARAVAAAPAGKRTEARMDLAIARTCHHHFQSVANQLAFYRFREMGAAGRDGMRKMAEAEISLAIAQFPVARDWSVIGYEASNHYYYTPLDLVEKVLNCRAILDELRRA